MAATTTVKAIMPGATTNPATNFTDTTTDQVVLVTQNGTGVALSASAPSNTAIVGTSNASASAGVVAGVEGISGFASRLSYGIYGRATSSTADLSVGAYGQSDATRGIGAEGNALGTGSTIGLLGQSNSTSGVAVSAVETATSGSTYGLSARIFSPTGGGLWILNSASGTVTGPLIRALTNAGTQFQVGGNGSVSAAGSISGTRLISTVGTGTAPLQVASTTLVPNLNASLLGGSPASAFAPASGAPGYIQNGIVTQASTNFNISGNGTVGGTLAGNAVNSTTTYEIGGSAVLSIGSAADGNLFAGSGAGANNTPGVGTQNTFLGFQAGYLNATGGYNTFNGYQAGYFNTSGGGNTFTGYAAGLDNTTGAQNSFFGLKAGLSNTSGYANTFIGYTSGSVNQAGYGNTFVGFATGNQSTGNDNTFSGSTAGYFNTTGSNNVFSGFYAGHANTTGSDNTYIGYEAGLTNNGTDNIYLGDRVDSSMSGENNTMRLGSPSFISSTYVAGVSGTATSSGVPVFIDATGKLGTTGGSLGGVTSFNGRTGAVVPAANDYGFSLLSGTLGGSQLSGAYGNAVTLSNTSNVYYGNGSNLTGVIAGAGSPYYIQNGTTQQPSANFNISGSGSANSFNSATNYQIGGNSVLSAGSSTLFVGLGAGGNNTGVSNTFSGSQAGFSNTLGCCNAFFGFRAGYSNTLGGINTFIGWNAGSGTIQGSGLTFVGGEAEPVCRL